MYLKRFADLTIFNILFVFTSVFSLFILFFPGIISLHTIANRILNNENYHFKDFFLEIKIQWSFMWRVALLATGVIIGYSIVIYLMFTFIYNAETLMNNVFIVVCFWFALAFFTCLAIILIIWFFHLMIFNSYFKDDTFKMMLLKSALIARKKILISFIAFMVFASIVILSYFVPVIGILGMTFFFFSYFAYFLEAIARKTYTILYQEELKRSMAPENIFYPMVIDDKEKNKK